MVGKFVLRVSVLAVLLFQASLRAEDELESLQLKYEIERERLRAPLIDLRKKYQQRLQAIFEEYSAEGDLSKALAARSAAEAKGDPDGASIDAAPEKVAEAQRIYLKAKRSREKQESLKQQELARAYRGRLEKLRVELTKNGAVDAAVAVDGEIGKIEKTLRGLALRIGASKGLCAISITSNLKVSIEELRAGAERLSGGYRPKFLTVAKEVEGAEFTKVPWTKTTSFEITAQEEGFIYLIRVPKDFDPPLLHERVDNPISGPYIYPRTTARIVLERGQKLKFTAGEGGIIAKQIKVTK